MKGSRIFFLLIFVISIPAITAALISKKDPKAGSWWVSSLFENGVDNTEKNATKNETEPETEPKAKTEPPKSHFQEFLDANPLKRVHNLFIQWIYNPIHDYFYPSTYQKLKMNVKSKFDAVTKELKPKLTVASSGYNPLLPDMDKKVSCTVSGIWDSHPTKEVRRFFSTYFVDPVRSVLPKTYAELGAEHWMSTNELEWFSIGLVVGVFLTLAVSYLGETFENYNVSEDLLDSVQEWSQPSAKELMEKVIGPETSEGESENEESAESSGGIKKTLAKVLKK